jgi:sodium-dependent dicarboxylate transporter 2/3/5
VRSIQYLTHAIPANFSDCVDYMSTHELKEVSLSLETENDFGQNIIIVRLLARFCWLFSDRTVEYSEVMGGIVEHEKAARQQKSIINANFRLEKRKKDFEELGIDLKNKELHFEYEQFIPSREEVTLFSIEKICAAMREFYKSFPPYRFNWKKMALVLLASALFLVVYLMPQWPGAIDPAGQMVPLTREGRGAIAICLMAVILWIFEALPMAVITISIGLFQAFFGIRSSYEAFRDFMDPAVLFIFGSITLGMSFTKTGLAKRFAYRMLDLVGEKTSMILLGSFILTAGLSHIMTHTAAAAAVFPIFMTIYTLYEKDKEKPTRFGKALFIGMAFAAGAGSIVTFLGSSRAPAAAGIFEKFTGEEITFVALTKYMFLIGWAMVSIVWLLMILFFRPERRAISGLRERVKRLSKDLGPLSPREKTVLTIAAGIILLMVLGSFVPFLRSLDRTSIMLVAAVLLYLLRILTVEDLKDVPWNVILIFSGAMSLGFCLWKTGAARWIALKWLVMFQTAPWMLFVLSAPVLVLVMTNFITNVAAITVTLPISLTLAGYLGIPPETILYACLVTAGMPFLLLIGSPPNAIAYSSGQFRSAQFFVAGVPTSIVLIGLLALFLRFVWPVLGMPVFPS